jgi:hypothetical protein
MCTFQSERAVLVCDEAIGRVRRDVTGVLGKRVRFTPVEGQGTLVQADQMVDFEVFGAVARAAIAAAQESHSSGT